MTIIEIIVFSLCIGSFLNVVIYRLPIIMEAHWHKEKPPFSLLLPRSHCPHCKMPIRWLHNIPVLSFIFLRARCGCCKRNISWRYPVIELTSAVVPLIVYSHFGWSMFFFTATIFSWMSIALVAIDLQHQLLPDFLTLSLLAVGLIVNAQHVFVMPTDAIFGAIAGYAFLWLIAKGYYLMTKREGMGQGDFKLLAAIGAWVGWQGLLPVIVIASMTGSVMGLILLSTNRAGLRTPIPFGPYLAIAGWIVLVWSDFLVQLFPH